MGLKIANVDGWFGKSDPVLKFFKQRANGDLLQVHETEVIMNNLDPVFKEFQINDSKLCTAHNQWFRVECWDWQKTNKYQYIGQCDITLDMVKSGKQCFELFDVKKNHKTGTLKVSNFSIQQRPSFLDFLRGGVQLNAIVAIDFTNSNCHTDNPNSLHAMSSYGDLNEYQKAISAVASIVLKYDFDQQVPVYGFGGKPHFPSYSSHNVSHCFPCTGNLSQAEVNGLAGIMEAYANALKYVELSGPTYFAPLLNEAIKICEENRQLENEVYSLLLILTDGEIHDIEATTDAIIRAAYLPMSVIIIGIGNAEFGKMEELDGDEGLCNSRGQRAMRDLVQFVPFKDFNGDMAKLARRVLAEVPDQLVEYMRLVNKKPKSAQVVDITKQDLNPNEPDLYSQYGNYNKYGSYEQGPTDNAVAQFDQLNVNGAQEADATLYAQGDNPYDQYSGFARTYSQANYGTTQEKEY